MEVVWEACIEVDLIDEKFLSLAFPHNSLLSASLDKSSYIFYPLQIESRTTHCPCINESRVLPLPTYTHFMFMFSLSPLLPCFFDVNRTACYYVLFFHPLSCRKRFQHALYHTDHPGIPPLLYIFRLYEQKAFPVLATYLFSCTIFIRRGSQTTVYPFLISKFTLFASRSVHLPRF